MLDVERVARAICLALGDDPDREGPWETWWLQSPYATAARMAMRETRLIDAEALRAMADENEHGSLIWGVYRGQADWHQSRAGDTQ